MFRARTPRTRRLPDRRTPGCDDPLPIILTFLRLGVSQSSPHRSGSTLAMLKKSGDCLTVRATISFAMQSESCSTKCDLVERPRLRTIEARCTRSKGGHAGVIRTTPHRSASVAPQCRPLDPDQYSSISPGVTSRRSRSMSIRRVYGFGFFVLRIRSALVVERFQLSSIGILPRRVIVARHPVGGRKRRAIYMSPRRETFSLDESRWEGTRRNSWS